MAEDIENTPPKRTKKSEKRDDVKGYDRREHTPRDEHDKRTSWLWPLLAVLALLLLAWLAFRGSQGGNITNINQNQQEKNQDQGDFGEERRAQNLQKVAPSHAATIPAPPPNVIVQTNTPSTTQNSQITIIREDRDYGVGDTMLSRDGRTLRRSMEADVPNGVYVVNYRVCGQDNNCQDGRYAFRVDKDNREGYEDQRNRETATITVANDRLYPERLVVSRNTRVAMTNSTEETVEITAGPEGIQNFFASLSGSIAPNNSFSYTFERVGYYPYHLKIGDRIQNGILVVQ